MRKTLQQVIAELDADQLRERLDTLEETIRHVQAQDWPHHYRKNTRQRLLRGLHNAATLYRQAMLDDASRRA